MSDTTMKTQYDSILKKIEGSEKLINRGTFLQPPVMWWQNDITPLNATNLNKLSQGIKNIQDEFNQSSIGLEEILSDIVINNAGWVSAESASGTIFNDLNNNRVVGEYATAFGHNTTAGKVYIITGDEQINSGKASYVAGEGTFATSDHQYVIGKWNILDEEDDQPGDTYAFIIGNGESDSERSNAFTVDWEGSGVFSKNLHVANNLTLGTNGNDNHTINGKTCFKHSVRTHNNLKVDKKVTIGETLNVGGNTELTGTLNVAENTILAKDLNVGVNTTITGILDVGGVANLAKSLSVGEDIDVIGSLNVDTNADIKGILTVTGLSEFKDDVNFSNSDKSVNIYGALNVAGQTVLQKTNIMAELCIFGTTTVDNDVEITNGNLTLSGSEKVGEHLSVDGNTDILGTLNVGSETSINDNLNVSGKSEFTGTITVQDETTLNVTTISDTLTVDAPAYFKSLVEIDDTLSVANEVTSTNDFIINKLDSSYISLSDEHAHLDYNNLQVSFNNNDTDEQKLAKRTVPNAIAYTEAKLIGKTELNTENLGETTVPTLSSDTIYGVAQYSLNLVKNLLNAYILDGDNDDPEARSAIDKLIEISDWIQSDDAGAGKIISDLSAEILRSTGKDTELTNSIAAEVTRASAKETELNNKIDNEISRATSAEELISQNLSKEITRAQAAEATECNRATAQENALDAKIQGEITRAGTRENELANSLTVLGENLQGQITNLTSKSTEWDAAANQRHTHSNASVLDGISQDSVTQWNTASTNNHTHSNKGILDEITDELIENLQAAVEASHTHSNSSLLDSLTQEKIELWNTTAETVAAFENLDLDAINGVLDYGASITGNTNSISEIQSLIGDEETVDTLLYRLHQLEDKLNNLISCGTDDPENANITTKYYVKYEDGE